MPIASFADVVSVEPPSTTPGIASFGDILAIEPPPTPRKRRFDETPTPEERALVEASAPAISRQPPAPLPAAQPVVTPPEAPTDFGRALAASAPGRFLAGAAQPVVGIVQGGAALGRQAAATIQQGGFAAVPDAMTGIVSGAARSLIEPAVSAIVPPLLQRKPGEAALGAVDQVIPVRDIARRAQAGDLAGAAGEVASTLALIGGPHAVERLRAAAPPRAAAAEPAPVRPANAPLAPPVAEPTGAPRLPPEMVAVGDEAAFNAGRTPPLKPEPGVAHVSEIVSIEPPKEVPGAHQEQSPAAVAVRQQTGDGEAVGGGHPEPRGTARASDIVEVLPPAEAPPRGPGEEAPPVTPGVAHVRDIVDVLPGGAEQRRLPGDVGQVREPRPLANDPNPIRVERFTNLPGEQGALQDRAAAAVETTPTLYVDRYRERFGNVVSADNAKELFPEYAATPEARTQHDAAVHRPASAVAQAVYDRLLEEPPPPGRTNMTVLLAGGTGSGKSSTLEAFLPELRDRAHVIYDSTLTDVDAAARNIEHARRVGDDVVVAFTDRAVEDAFRATLQRASTEGRPVTLQTHLSTHLKAPDVFQQLQERYAQDPHVEFFVVANSAAGRDLVPLEDWTPRRYNRGDVQAHLERILAEEHAAGRITDTLQAAVSQSDRSRTADTGGAREGQPGAPSGRPAEDPRGTREVTPDVAHVGDIVSIEPPAPLRKPAVSDLGKQTDEPLSMPNPGRRADASGALIPSPASRAIAGLSKEKQLRPSEIVREIAQHLDQLPVNVGKFKQRALGIYKPKEQTIRLKVANDLEVFAHELGHHIHESLLGAEVPPTTHRAELLQLGAATSRPSYSLTQKLAEGQAEFTRLYLSDPAKAKSAAPGYYQAFEHGLEQHPELAGVLQRAQRQYVGHLSQDPVTRGLAHLDFDGVHASPKADVVTRLQTAWVDDLTPLRKMVDDLAHHQPIDYTRDGYVLARLARGASAKADGFLKHGVRAADGTFIAAALEPALKPVKGQIREFAGYLAALRAVELRGRGMETGMSLDEARAIVQKFQSPVFDAARDAVYQYQDGMLVYATHAGTLSVDQLKAIKALNTAYVPFQRVLDDVGATAAAGGGGPIANKATPVKRIKGSGRDIINPLESIVRNTHTLVGMVEQNRAMRALVDQATQTTGGGRYLEAIPEKQIATTFNLDRVARDIKGELDAAGVDYPQNLDFDKVVTVFTPTQFRMGEKGVVSVLKNGKRQWYQVNDQALYDAIAAVGPKSSDLLVNLFMKPARLLRAGATTTVGFIARNPIRDTFEATVNSRYGFRPAYDTVKGLFEFAQKGDDYQHFLNSGAGNAAMVGMDRNRLRQELVKLGAVEKRKFLDSVVLNPVNLLQAVSEAMEHATRLGEFKRAVETEGRTAEGYARAALAARDVTIDFARGGSVSKEINRYTAFFNAGVQGTARLAEVFHRNPVGATWRALATVTLPAIAAYAINQDDPAYHELPDWERNTYYHIPLGRGPGHSWVRVPKPFTLGQIFANVPEAALDYIGKQDPEALRRVLPDKQTAWKQLVALLPTALMPAVEVATNYDTFRDRAIVNPSDVNLDTELQYNRWTSELAKYVGPKIGIPPAKLDHLIYGYGAGLAGGVVQGLDKAAAATGLVEKAKPAGGPARWPLTGTFYRETPGADARSLEQFYRLRDRVEGAIGSIRRYEKANEPAAMAARQAQARTDFGPDAGKTLDRVRAVDKALTDLRDGVNQVFANARLTPDDKKELLDRLYEQMVNAARAGLEKPALPSRFRTPPAPALLKKLTPATTAPLPGKPSAVSAPAAGVGSPLAVPVPPRPSAGVAARP